MTHQFSTHIQAEKKYAQLRQAAYFFGSRLVAKKFGAQVKITPINDAARSAFARTWLKHVNRPDWDWPSFILRHQRVTPQRFDVAIWWGEELCGLVFMKPSVGKTFLGIRLIEGAPWIHPLKGKIIPIGVAVAYPYARGLKTNELRVCNPLPEAVEKYEKANFSIVRRGKTAIYCVRRI